MIQRLPLFLISSLILGGCASAKSPGSAPAPAPAPAEKAPVIACWRMDEITYRNPEVVDCIANNFVAIQVDSESRPDLGERYSDWAWPATILDDLIARQQQGRLVQEKNRPYAAPEKRRGAQAKALHFERDGRYPRGDKAALFICTSQACSRPITDANKINAEALPF